MPNRMGVNLKRASRATPASRGALTSLLLVFGEVILLVLIGALVAVSLYLIGILAEIENKDFSPANIRIAAYRRFFENLKRDGFQVEESKPYINAGVRYFLWAVETPDGRDRLIYRWKHDLSTNKVEPLTSPATYLDIELGHIKKEDAMAYPFEPEDELAEKIAKGTYEIRPPKAEESEELKNEGTRDLENGEAIKEEQKPSIEEEKEKKPSEKEAEEKETKEKEKAENGKEEGSEAQEEEKESSASQDQQGAEEEGKDEADEGEAIDVDTGEEKSTPEEQNNSKTGAQEDI